MKNKFLELYNSVMNSNSIDSRIFYEMCDKTSFFVDELENKNFYNDVIKIDNSNKKFDKIFEEINITKGEKLIIESYPDANLKKELINKIYSCENYDQIKLSFLLNHISECFKEKHEIKMKEDLPIYVFKFSFKKPNLIPKIFQSFKIKFSLEAGTLKDKFKYEN